tara:strand:+ start:364 stop:792 length:429 start_codon:yes stop_codon:yes gene_type:complete
MLGPKVKSRIYFFSFAVILTGLIIFMILRALDENVIYFHSPSDIYKKTVVPLDEKIRIGGLVKENSIEKNGSTINFIVTDLKHEIIVTYKGLVPNLFSEGKGVVAEGMLRDKKYFIADKILAKHDENYMPPEVSKSLEKSNN